MRHLRTLLIGFCLLLAVGCSNRSLLPPELDAVPTVPAADATPDGATSGGSIAEQTTTVPVAGRRLNVWLVPGLSNSPDAPGGAVLSELLDGFAAMHGDVTLSVQVKNIGEQGGTLSYLRAGRSVAPSVLPDLIVLPTDLLALTAEEGLIIPLNDLVVTDGLYPAALSLGQIDETIYGYPFAFSELYHFVYNANVLTEGLPGRWSDLLTLNRARLTFAGAGRDAGVLALHAYSDAGGALGDVRPRYKFEAAPLVQALTRLQSGAEGTLIAPGTMTVTSADDAWSRFQSGQANLVMVEASRQLERRTQGNRSEFAPLSGGGGPMRPIVRGWAWAVTTPAPAEQALAAELIAWLTEPNNLGRWSVAAHMLPTRPVAFAAWDSDPYVTFLQAQLQDARAYPNTLDSTAFTAINNAAIAVLTGVNTPQDAAQTVVNTQQP